MRSGELARQAGVNVQTLRYYERIGLLPRTQRECPILSEIEQVRSGKGSMTSDGAGSRSAP